MADPSFDVVSKVDKMEVSNALDQASKEVIARYDFKNTGSSIEWSGEKIVIVSNADDRVRAVLDVFQEKLIKRGVSLKSLEHGDPKPAGGSTSRLEITLVAGLSTEKAKLVVKTIKEAVPKGVQAQINGETVKVTGKKRDDLQTAIAALKKEDLGVPLQFENFK